MVCALVGAHLFASMAKSNVQVRLTLVMAAQQRKYVFPLPEILTGNFVQNHHHYQILMAVRFFVMKYTEKFYAQQKCLLPDAKRKLRVCREIRIKMANTVQLIPSVQRSVPMMKLHVIMESMHGDVKKQQFAGPEEKIKTWSSVQVFAHLPVVAMKLWLLEALMTRVAK